MPLMLNLSLGVCLFHYTMLSSFVFNIDSIPLLIFFGMWNDLEKILDRRVDFVTKNSLADFARESVEHDKILIYERAD